jgi:hypothetical protein
MVVIPSTGASRYHNCCIDGATGPEYFGYTLVNVDCQLFTIFFETKLNEKMTVNDKLETLWKEELVENFRPARTKEINEEASACRRQINRE